MLWSDTQALRRVFTRHDSSHKARVSLTIKFYHSHTGGLLTRNSKDLSLRQIYLFCRRNERCEIVLLTMPVLVPGMLKNKRPIALLSVLKIYSPRCTEGSALGVTAPKKTALLTPQKEPSALGNKHWGTCTIRHREMHLDPIWGI